MRTRHIYSPSHDRLYVHVVLYAIFAAFPPETGMFHSAKAVIRQCEFNQSMGLNLRSGSVRDDTCIDSHHAGLETLRHSMRAS